MMVASSDADTANERQRVARVFVGPPRRCRRVEPDVAGRDPHFPRFFPAHVARKCPNDDGCFDLAQLENTKHVQRIPNVRAMSGFESTISAFLLSWDCGSIALKPASG
jgi:hypothetical protein